MARITIDLDLLSDDVRHRIELIRATAAFKDGETLRLKDVILGMIELGSVRAFELMEDRNDHDFK